MSNRFFFLFVILIMTKLFFAKELIKVVGTEVENIVSSKNNVFVVFVENENNDLINKYDEILKTLCNNKELDCEFAITLVSKNGDVVKKNRLRRLPSAILFKNSIPIYNMNGVTSAENIKNLIKSIL